LTLNVLNYGGGWQTTGLLVLIEQGKLPRPDRIIIADTGREKKSTWRYLEGTARPHMQAIGLDIEIAPRNLAYVDIYAHNGDLLLPAYTANGKLTAFCSNEWKQRVVDRYLHLTELGHARSDIANMTQDQVRAEMKRPAAEVYVNWIGFAFDERDRIKDPTRRRFPLIDLMLTKEDNRNIVRASGWGDPTTSACWMCANLSNEEWRDIRENDPADFESACVLDEEIRENDIFNGGTGVWLHHSRVPLREADLDAEDRKGPARQCGLGLCMI
jgi:hypothetical protein